MNKALRSLLYIFIISIAGVLLMSTPISNTLLSSSITKISGTASNLNNELLEFVNPEKPTHDHSSVYYKRFYVSKFNLGRCLKFLNDSTLKQLTYIGAGQALIKVHVFWCLYWSQ